MYVCVCVCVYETNLFGWPLTLSNEEFVEIQVAPKPVTGIELITCQGGPKPVTPTSRVVLMGLGTSPSGLWRRGLVNSDDAAKQRPRAWVYQPGKRSGIRRVQGAGVRRLPLPGRKGCSKKEAMCWAAAASSLNGGSKWVRYLAMWQRALGRSGSPFSTPW